MNRLWWSWSPIIRCWAHMPLAGTPTWCRDAWEIIDQDALDDLDAMGCPAICDICQGFSTDVFGGPRSAAAPTNFLLQNGEHQYACRTHAPMVGTDDYFAQDWKRVTEDTIARVSRLEGLVLKCRTCLDEWRDAAEAEAP